MSVGGAPGGRAGESGGGGAPGGGAGESGGAGAPGGGGGQSGGGGAEGGSLGGVGGGDGCTSSVIPLPPTGCPMVESAPLGEASHPDEGATHVVTCSTACYGTAPPSSGNHYPSWPAYKAYEQPVPWGFLVHGLEHGAIVVAYNCPCGCPDEIAAAKAWIATLPPDATCSGKPPRVVLAPDPTLDVRWSASAWTWTLRAAAFDPTAFRAFFDAHYNRAGEQKCDDGADGSVAGWCN